MTLENEMDIPDFQQILQDNPSENSGSADANNIHFDLSKITPQTENLLSLLETKSIFYDKPFVPLLKKNYKALSRHAKSLLDKDVVEFEPKVFESIEKVELYQIFFHLIDIIIIFIVCQNKQK